MSVDRLLAERQRRWRWFAASFRRPDTEPAMSWWVHEDGTVDDLGRRRSGRGRRLMLPWMSDSGDSRTSTSLLHYVTPDAQWQPDMVRKPGFDAICGERVLPLWSAYDHALETRTKCAECEQYAHEQEELTRREAPERERRRAATAGA